MNFHKNWERRENSAEMLGFLTKRQGVLSRTSIFFKIRIYWYQFVVSLVHITTKHSKDTKERGKADIRTIWLVLVIAGVLLAVGSLWWLCDGDSKIPFLPSSGRAEWIVCPMAPDAVEHDAAKVFAQFRRTVRLEETHAGARLRVRAFREGLVSINGRVVNEIELGEHDWKRIRKSDVSKYLKPGENEILVTVTNSLGPPALWVELKVGDDLWASDLDWEVSMLSGSWQKVTWASEPPKILPGNPLFGRERVKDSLRRCWPNVVMIILVAVAAMAGLGWGGSKKGGGSRERGGGRKIQPIWVLLAILLVWIVLFVNNLPQLPGLFGFDRDGHLYYIDYIEQKKALPLADEGWQTYQPPLYYLIGAVVTAPFKLSDAARKRDWHDLGKLPEWHSQSALVALRALSGIFGLAQIFLVFISLKRLFPQQTGAQVAGLLVAGFLPANVYLSHHVTNEGLGALFVTAALYFCIRIITGPVGENRGLRAEKSEACGCGGPPHPGPLPEERETITRLEWLEYVLVGVFLGLAMLTKFSALLAIPVVLVALLWNEVKKQTTGLQTAQTPRSLKETVETVHSKVGGSDTRLKDQAGLATGVNEGGRMPLISAIRSILVVLIAGVLVCGWHYVRVWHHFGKPLVGNWDPKLPIVWWQEPGFHTAAWYWRFGQSLVSPLYSSIFGFTDGLYSTLWGDGFCSGATGMQFRPPWNYDLMNACYLFSLIPMALIFLGAIVSLARFLRGPTAREFLTLALGAAFASGVLLMTLKIASYAQVKAFYALPILLVLCAFAGRGWDFVIARSRAMRWIMRSGLMAWSILVVCTFWIRSDSPQTQTAKGLQSISADRFGEAEERLSQVLREHGHYLPARIGLINLLRETRRLEDARREAESLVEKYPEQAEGYFQLGLTLQAEGKDEEAIGKFQQARMLGPQHLGAYQHLALSLSNLKRYREAVKTYKEGLCVYPLSFELLNNLAWLRATCADPAERNGTEAVLLAETACQLTSYERPILVGTLAAAYARAGRFNEAVRTAEKARELASAMGQESVAKRNVELDEIYRSGRAYSEE